MLKLPVNILHHFIFTQGAKSILVMTREKLCNEYKQCKYFKISYTRSFC
jgi:hypothetical protein